jgi:hypothetical protein
MGSIRLSVVDQSRIASCDTLTEMSSESFITQTLTSIGRRIDKRSTSSVAQCRRVRSTAEVRHFTVVSDVGITDFLVTRTGPCVIDVEAFSLTAAFDGSIVRTFVAHVGSVRETSKVDKLGMTAITRRFEVEIVDSIIRIGRTRRRRFLCHLTLGRVVATHLVSNVFTDTGATLTVVELVDVTGVSRVPRTV